MKYNRTVHLPFSSGTMDDKITKDVSTLLNKPLVMTLKCDGSNVCLERDNCFARTHSGPPSHVSFDGLKALHAECRYHIPDHIQVFGEWLYAKHSIEYTELPHYFLAFGVRDLSTEMWESWDIVQLWSDVLGVPTVPVLWEGMVSNEKQLQEICNSFMKERLLGGEVEGMVVRIRDEFINEDFSKYIMKMVRPNHVSPNNDHWKHQEVVKNKLKDQ